MRFSCANGTSCFLTHWNSPPKEEKALETGLEVMGGGGHLHKEQVFGRDLGPVLSGTASVYELEEDTQSGCGSRRPRAHGHSLP